MKQNLCPKCFHKYDPQELAYACSRSGCKSQGVPVTGMSINSGAKPVNLTCSSCGGVIVRRLCPECGYAFDIDAAADIDTLAISIVGAEGSGKSNYLSVLINQIKLTLGKVYDCALYPLGGDDTIRQYDEQYYKPLFVSGQSIASTSQSEVMPLIYSLVFGEDKMGKTCNLTFYDACGSNFEDGSIMADFNRSIYNSRGILFFIDPAQFPVLREHCKVLGGRSSDGDVNALLARTINLIRQGSGQTNLKKKISAPIAICVTKLDVIRSQLDPSSFLKAPSRHLSQPAFDSMDFESCNLEMQSLIESWSGVDLVNQISSQFSTFGFFGLSSLGSPPNSVGQVHHIAPHRVCDPLLWILWKNRVIRATEPE